MGAKTSQQMLDAADYIIAMHAAGTPITVYACCKHRDIGQDSLARYLRKIGRADLIQPRKTCQK